MTAQELQELDVWTYINNDGPNGIGLVAIQSEGFGHQVKLDAVTLSRENAAAMHAAVERVALETERHIYLVRCRFAEIVTVIVPRGTFGSTVK